MSTHTVNICPCQMQQIDPLPYEKCCQPFHEGKAAPNVEALMRSRFSGFVLGLTEYVIQTWHPDTCPKDLELQPDTHWKRLDIIATTHITVHFKAYSQDESGEFQCLEEMSEFEKLNDRWVYLNGDVSMGPARLQRNDTCLCGSGKKFKKCCGK